MVNAESYVSAADCATYAQAQGAPFDPTLADAEPALRRATRFIDSYWRRFPGFRTHLRLQALEWPRSAAFVYNYDYGSQDYYGYRPYRYYDPNWFIFQTNEIPAEIIKATNEAAIRELASPGVMLPDQERGGQVRAITRKAGDTTIQTQWAANAAANTTFMAIDAILAKILRNDNAGGLAGVATRG